MFLSCPLWFLPVVAPLNEIPAATIDNLMRYLPILRQPEFGLMRAADYLESWCNGSLVRMPLLDLSEFFAFTYVTPIKYMICVICVLFWRSQREQRQQQCWDLRTRLRRSRQEPRVPSDLFSRIDDSCYHGSVLPWFPWTLSCRSLLQDFLLRSAAESACAFCLTYVCHNLL